MSGFGQCMSEGCREPCEYHGSKPTPVLCIYCTEHCRRAMERGRLSMETQTFLAKGAP